MLLRQGYDVQCGVTQSRTQASRAVVVPQVLADVPPTAKCPKCRQRYVFREVLELHEFGAVIRFKCVPC